MAAGFLEMSLLASEKVQRCVSGLAVIALLVSANSINDFMEEVVR